MVIIMQNFTYCSEGHEKGFLWCWPIMAIAYGCLPTLYRDVWPFLGRFYECVPIVKISKFDKANWLGHES